jgi:hypothetical protein
MATEEERIKVLKMIQEGTISAEQGLQLLEALDEGVKRANKGRPVPPTSPAHSARSGRWFRVLITDTNSGKTRVNVRLPISMVNAGIKMGARFAPEIEGLDTEQLMSALNAGETGKIVDVYDNEDGEHVEVFIE